MVSVQFSEHPYTHFKNYSCNWQCCWCALKAKQIQTAVEAAAELPASEHSCPIADGSLLWSYCQIEIFLLFLAYNFSLQLCGKLESTLFKFHRILVFSLHFVLTVSVLNKRCCLGLLSSSEILLNCFTFKFFRIKCEFPLKVRVFQKSAISVIPVFGRSVFFSPGTPGNSWSENQENIRRRRGVKLLEPHDKNLECLKCILVVLFLH